MWCFIIRISSFYAPASRQLIEDRTIGLALFVDLFFLISGFVIAYVYFDRIGTRKQLATFFQRRVGRLVPLHWLTLALSIGLYALIAGLGLQVNRPPTFSVECITGTALLVHAIAPCGGVIFNGVSWSISAEIAMYLAFPFFIVVAKFWKPAPLALAAIAATIIGTAIFESGATLLTYDWTEMSPVARATPSFLLGISLYQYRTTMRLVPAADIIMGISLVILAIMMLNGAPTIASLFMVWIVGALAVAADLKEKPKRIFKTLSPLGQLTYSIYMWHSLIILILMNGIGDKLLHASPALMFAIMVVCYVTILLVSYVSFFYIETPARIWVDNLGRNTNQARQDHDKGPGDKHQLADIAKISPRQLEAREKTSHPKLRPE